MRYQVIESSQTSHCCFEYSIVDTKKQITTRSGKVLNNYDGSPMYECICELFDKEIADHVCKLLNAELERN